MRNEALHLPAHQYLDDRGIPYRKLSFPVETEKGAAAVARALGFAERQMVKSLIFVTGSGEKVQILVGGDQNAVSGLLKKVVGNRNVRLASLPAVQQVTGYAVGSIPPFSWQPEGFRTFLENSLLAFEELGVGAGRWGQEIVIAPRDLVAACGAEVVNLVDRSLPVRPEDGSD